MDPVQAHYDRHPYPHVEAVVAATPPRYEAGRLSMLLRRRRHALTTTPRIWVAGCGTTQAAQWALTFPEAEVVATDLSARTLDQAEAVTRALGLAVRFEQRDLGEGIEGSFDLVICTGVVHHLADPTAGLRAIRAALRPHGAALVMVYNRFHRALLDPIRRAAARLGAHDEDPYEAACRVLGAALGERCRPADRAALEELFGARYEHRTFLADILCHPREQSYDPVSFVELLAGAGLRRTEWCYPGSWGLGDFFSDPVLVERARALEPVEQAQLICEVAALGSPMLDALVERDDAPVSPPYGEEEWMAMRMILSGGDHTVSVEDLANVRHQQVPHVVLRDGRIEGHARSGHGPPRPFVLPASARAVLEACDGTRTVAELCDAFADEGTRDELVAMVKTLSPLDVGLLAPDLGS